MTRTRCGISDVSYCKRSPKVAAHRAQTCRTAGLHRVRRTGACNLAGTAHPQRSRLSQRTCSDHSCQACSSMACIAPGDPPSKRPRVVNVHAGRSHVTARGLEATLRFIQTEGLPNHFSASHQRRERQRFLTSESLFGDVVRMLEVLSATPGETVEVAFAHPLALLQRPSWKAAPSARSCVGCWTAATIESACWCILTT